MGYAAAACSHAAAASLALSIFCGTQDLKRSAAQLASRGAGEVHAIVANATKPGDAQRVAEETATHFGGIDVLVNNLAGVGDFSVPFENLTDEYWVRIFELNVMSAVRMFRAVVPHIQRQRWGRIISTSSESRVQPHPVMPQLQRCQSRARQRQQEAAQRALQRDASPKRARISTSSFPRSR